MAESNPTAALLPAQESLATDPKAEKDLSEPVNALLSEIAKGVDADKVEEVGNQLLNMEKACRLGLDGNSSVKLVNCLLEVYSRHEMYDALAVLLTSLSRKRQQLKRVQTAIVKGGTELVEKITNKGKKIQFIQSLTELSANKIFVEVERARLVLMHAHLLEEDGKIEEAANLLQDVSVDAYGNMDLMERSEYILEQMRLVLARQNFLRLQILSKKISVKLLDTKDMREVKRKYFKYLVEYHLHESEYREVAKDYWKIAETYDEYDTPECKKALQHHLLYLIISPHSEESLQLLSDFQKKFDKDKYPYLLPHRRLCNSFLLKELVNWPLEYEAEVKCSEVFTISKHWDLFKNRFFQRNLLVVSNCYSRVRLEHISVMLSITLDEVETVISQLVNEKVLYAKIARPDGIVTFGKPPKQDEILDKWSSQVSTLLDVLQQTTHLINNDRMVQAALTSSAAAAANTK